MQTLIEFARTLKPGQRIRIAHYDPEIPKGKRLYSKSLTDAQIFAYQERWVVNVEWSKDKKEALVTVIDRRDYKYLLDGII